MSITRHTSKFWIRNDLLSLSTKIVDGNVAPHWHEFYELEIILEGSGIYNVDDVDYIVERGALYFMSPISFHKIKFEGEVKLINVMFTDTFCNEDFLLKILKNSPHFYTMLNDYDLSFISTLADDVSRHGENRCGQEYLSAILNCILAKITDLLSIQTAENMAISPIGRVVMYIKGNLKAKLDLESVAAIAGYSPNYFSVLFKQEMNATFHSYVTDCRLAFAKNLLRYCNLSVTEVCYECGFLDYSNFLRCFKQNVGMSPRQFRTAVRKGQSKPDGDFTEFENL